MKILLSIIFVFIFASPLPAQFILKEGKIPADLVITLRRTACFGNCPAYSLIITADGKTEFKRTDYGLIPVQENIAPSGTGSVSHETLKLIILEFEKINFFKLKKSYSKKSDGCGQVWTDNPSETISILINGRKKTVYHYFGCEKVKGDVLGKIINLGRFIDESVNTSQWIK